MDYFIKKYCASCLLALTAYGSTLCKECLLRGTPDMPSVEYSAGDVIMRVRAMGVSSGSTLAIYPLPEIEKNGKA